MAHIQISELIPAGRFDVFDYLTDVRNLPSSLAPAIEARVFNEPTELKRGAEAHLALTRFGLTQSVRWRVEDVLRGSRLSFRQVEGIFAAWTQTTRFEAADDNATLVTELVDYRVPGGLLGYLADDFLIKRDLANLLRTRLRRAGAHFKPDRSSSKPSAT